MEPLAGELRLLHEDIDNSELYRLLEKKYSESDTGQVNMNALKVPCIAEKALVYLYAEVNLITEVQLRTFCENLRLDRTYIEKTLADNRRPVTLG